MQAGRNGASRTIEVYDLLPPDTAVRRQPVRQARPVLVEDAVFEVVASAPARRENNDNPVRSAPARRDELTRLAAVAGVYLVNRLERLLSGLSTQAFATLSASLFFFVFWFCGGFGALDRQPIAAPIRAVSIVKVFTEERDENGMRLLAVGGVLMNQSDANLAVPPLSVVGEGGEVIGSITPSVTDLATGQSVRFFSRFKLTGGKSGAVTIFPAAE